ncbi:unnamed protein product [Callosobruchus maculatus]|uniref:Uncharacterized protein n=1 Tax=Callosobruchus maculatus TaxID=64391 RepID=A0A653BKS1_CALMS|nr:unnamed protein product [Callosobruchus maculatus]
MVEYEVSPRLPTLPSAHLWGPTRFQLVVVRRENRVRSALPHAPRPIDDTLPNEQIEQIDQNAFQASR